jgi:hypothetical protein
MVLLLDEDCNIRNFGTRFVSCEMLRLFWAKMRMTLSDNDCTASSLDSKAEIIPSTIPSERAMDWYCSNAGKKPYYYNYCSTVY